MPSGMHRTAVVYIGGGDLCAERAGYRSAIMSLRPSRPHPPQCLKIIKTNWSYPSHPPHSGTRMPLPGDEILSGEGVGTEAVLADDDAVLCFSSSTSPSRPLRACSRNQSRRVSQILSLYVLKYAVPPGFSAFRQPRISSPGFPLNGRQSVLKADYHVKLTVKSETVSVHCQQTAVGATFQVFFSELDGII